VDSASADHVLFMNGVAATKRPSHGDFLCIIVYSSTVEARAHRVLTLAKTVVEKSSVSLFAKPHKTFSTPAMRFLSMRTLYRFRPIGMRARVAVEGRESENWV